MSQQDVSGNTFVHLNTLSSLFLEQLIAAPLCADAGEMGSRLDTDDELSYYDAIAQYTQLGDGRDSTLSGWIWWAYNANSNGKGRLGCYTAGLLMLTCHWPPT